MNTRTISVIAGVSYLVIFVSAIYANFFALEAILENPEIAIGGEGLEVRLGALAFLVAAVFDVIVAWALYELYKGHVLSTLSTYFRVAHAVIMGAAVFALVSVPSLMSSEAVLAQVDVFNSLWLIGLFFFGVHLLLLGKIIKNVKIIPFALMIAGAMYMIDTAAHFLLPNYATYADLFLLFVAVPSIFGEMALALWLLFRKDTSIKQ